MSTEIADTPNTQLFTNALIVGKFGIFHAGHCFLIESAMALCHTVYVCICSRHDDSISGQIRCQWIEKTYETHIITGRLIIHHITKEIQEAHVNNPQAPKIWAREIQTEIPVKFDAVFASENYGWDLANYLDAKFIPIDTHRDMIPVSSGAIAINIHENWKYVPSAVRASFVLLFGVRSDMNTIRRFAKEIHADIYIPYALRETALHLVEDKSTITCIAAEIAVLKRMSNPIICIALPFQDDSTFNTPCSVFEERECKKIFTLDSHEAYKAAYANVVNIMRLDTQALLKNEYI